jgi:hypothetical protein
VGVKAFFKRLFGFVVGGVKFVFANTQVDEFAKQYLVSIAQEAARLALDNAYNNAQRFERLQIFIRALAAKAGIEVKEHLVRLLAELAVAKAKGSVKESA